MSKYFISVYKSYLNRIESDKNIETRYNTLVDNMTLFESSLNNYINSIDNSLWNEKGKNSIVNNIIPKIKEEYKLLSNGVLYNLNKVINLVKNDLYPMLLELKEKDEKYCLLQDKVKKEEASSLDMEQMKSMDTTLVNLVKKIDNKILEIKEANNINKSDDVIVSSIASTNLDDNKNDLLKLMLNLKDSNDGDIISKLKYLVEENKINKMLSGSAGYFAKGVISSDQLNNPNCVDLSLLNENWKVINTKTSVSEYATIASNKGIRQDSNPEKYGDHCLAFSYVHASNLYNGEVDSGAEAAYNWKHASEFSNYYSDSKQETLKTIYNQIKEGKPVVMQVNGNTQGTSRHFVTVVGIKSSVKSVNDIKESDLLILDSWDGKLERMDTNSSRFMTTGKQTNKSYSGYYLRLLN